MITIVPDRPRQDRVIERINKTLNERARSAGRHVGLPETFSVDAVNTMTHLINVGRSIPLDLKLPEEEHIGKRLERR